MSIRLLGSVSGYSELEAPSEAGDQTFTLPGTGGTLDRLNRAGNILQVVSTTKTDTFSTTAGPGAAATITGGTVTITPTSSSNKVLVRFSTVVDVSTMTSVGFELFRDSTNVGGGAPSGSRVSDIATSSHEAADRRRVVTGEYLDSPSTTSAVTYSVKTYSDVSGRTIYIGRSSTDADTNQPAGARTSFTITAMEVAA